VGAGNAGSTYGGGGGGGCTNVAGNQAGGLGGAGRVIVNWLPRLTTVTIASNNANTALAKVGDTVTLTFTASESVQATPTVTIAGHAVIPTPAGPGVGPYTATYVMVLADTAGVVPFTINFTDLTGNVGTQVTATTNGSSVTFDKTAPTVSSINRANPDPTIAASVSWTVIFSENVTGVDATDFALVPTGVSGAFITAVTGGGTTWTVTANTGIGSGTLGLNLVDNDTIIDAVGNPLGGAGAGNGNFPGQVYTITATPALAEYRMDEASWNGTIGEVVDSSGSGNHAQSFNSASTDAATPAIATNPGTCRYGVFDNGTTITQGYVQTPLPDLTTDFTVIAWIRTTNNTVGAQRILIDDQGTAPALGYGISLGEGGTGILRFYSRGITPVILDSTYTIANNTWYFVAAVADITNKKRIIYVFNAAGSLLNSTTEAAWTGGAWGTDGGPVSIGAETNASAETPAANHFKGNLDEVRVYQKVLNQSALAAIATQTHVCPVIGPDHIHVQHDGNGLTCTPEILTVIACANAACTTNYTASAVTGDITWAGTPGGTIPFNIIANGTTTVSLPVTTVQTVTLGTSAVNPAETNPPSDCWNTATATASCSLPFADSGLLVSVPNHVSETLQNITISAVRKSNNALNCVPAFANVSRAVNLKCVYSNPTTGTLPLRVAGTPLAANATSACSAGGATPTLAFDATGTATPTLQYADVGQMTLNGTYTGSAGTGDSGLSMTGSGSFIAAPASFAFSGITAPPIKAGNSFNATVTALNSLGAATPNFGKETSPESVTLTSDLVTPDPVTYPTASNPTPGNNVIAGTEFGAGGMVNDANGVATVNNLSWGEVGSITLTASLTSGSYLGSGSTATGTSATVGAFIPEHFDTAVVATATVPMPCPTGLTCPTLYNGFIYSGQPFSVQLTARKLAGGTTINYDGTFGLSKAVTLTAWDALGSTTTQNPGGGAVANGSVAAANFSAGVATTATPTYTFATVPTSPTDIYVRADDIDNVSSRRATLPLTSVEGGVKVANGRLKIANAHGSELLPLPIAVTAQYWKDATSGWVISSTDSLSSFVATNVLFSNYQKNLNASNYPNSGATSVTPASVVFANGVASYKLAKPGAGNNGSVDMTTNAPSYLPSNTARATFGVYKGANEFIYLRENY
jgi:MSHA biogenesis protein MshQ